MKLTSLLTGLAAAAACACGTARAEVLQTVTFTMTAYTQNSTSDNGTVTTTGNAAVRSINTQALLNLLAQDKQMTFPAGSKLAVSNGWFVVDKANNVLVDVSDILSTTEGNNEISSGKQSDTSSLACPALKKMKVVSLQFDDTATPGGSGLVFYLSGLATMTVNDTPPTSTGAYTETRTVKITGAAGEGTWGDGTPFVCTANISTTGKQSFGQTGPTGNWAPASLAGYTATVRTSSGQTIALTWGNSTWGQWGTANDTNPDDYCAGSYTYAKTGPNTAHLTSSDIGMLSWLNSSNYTDLTITMTSSTAGTCVMTSAQGTGSATFTLAHVNNLVPASLAGKAIQFTPHNGVSSGTIMAYAADGTFTDSKAGTVQGSGTYTVTQYSPTVAIIQHNYTDTGALVYVEANFSSASGGQAFYSYYQSPADGSNPDDSGPGTFSLQ